MDKTLEAMLGASLLFGGERLTKQSAYSKNPEISKIEEATTQWYETYKSPRKEQQVFELLKTPAGQDFIRKELNMNFEFGPPMTESDIKLECKWAFTLMLAKCGVVPSWQKGIFTFDDGTESYYADVQKNFLIAAGCDVGALEQVMNWYHHNSYYLVVPGKMEKFQENKREAQIKRESENLSKWVQEAKGRIDSVSDWFQSHINQKLEEEIYKDVSQMSVSSPMRAKFSNRFAKNKMTLFQPDTWRRDVKSFFWKWITAFEMAERGFVCAWQVDWLPEYKSDYLCFTEQIRILKQYDIDPWPLLQRLPPMSPTKYRTLEDVLFKT